MEKEYQDYNDLKCNVSVDGFTDFIFINRFGKLQHQGTLNKALKRIIRDCNDMQLLKKKRIRCYYLISHVIHYGILLQQD